jgi:hypothetical protein
MSSMHPEVDLNGLRKPAAWEYMVRFAFGGTVTVAAGLLGDRFGLALGGMFLAFPSILPASLTLVKRHDGRAKAVDDARGARIGTLGLAAFAASVVLAAGHLPGPLVLAAATCAWAIVAVGAWGAVRKVVGP